VDEIVRRVLDGRVVHPTTPVSHGDGGDELDQLRQRQQQREMEGLLGLGLQPVRGLLLYGPPGTGKTLLARELAKTLDARLKIVAAPELLDRWVGGTERLVRELFADAEYELYQVCGGDATRSALHVIVVDEIDAVFRKRSSATETSEVTRASAVNQILAKLDGVRALGNVLFVGLTNRRELLDEALLRPGRLEVQIEIPFPDREERREILQIHFGTLRRHGRLSRPLCHAIDGNLHSGGPDGINDDNDNQRLFSRWGRRNKMGTWSSIRDLAADRWTGGYSGADLAGLVRNAGSIALARARNQGDGGVEGLLITLDDVAKALDEKEPSFAASHQASEKWWRRKGRHLVGSWGRLLTFGCLIVVSAGIAPPSIATEAPPVSNFAIYQQQPMKRRSPQQSQQLDRVENLEDYRLSQCEEKGKQWEQCFFFGTDTVISTKSGKFGKVRPTANKAGIPTW